MSLPLFDLTGKRALVTGGTSGIGLAIVQALTQAGARVLTCSDRQNDVDQFDTPGASAICHRLSGRVAAEELVQQAIAQLGGVDILVSNAGIEGPVGGTGDTTEAAYLQAFDVNLHSAYWLCAASAVQMGAGSSIILMSSLSALRGNGKIGPYAMSKAALSQLARNLAVELGPRQIRANAIAPGLIATPFSKPLMQNPEFMARRLAATPLRRVGQPEEIAAAVVFLASAGGGFVTGQTLVIDGGTLITDGS